MRLGLGGGDDRLVLVGENPTPEPTAEEIKHIPAFFVASDHSSPHQSDRKLAWVVALRCVQLELGPE